MGSRESEKGRGYDETLHEVELSKGFWTLETAVTQALWNAFSRANPSEFEGDDLPVETVSRTQCARFVQTLNEGDWAPKGWKFDFPTEAEWEYACRAGSRTRYSFGNEITERDANYNFNVKRTAPVKTYAPNAWGFYDMHGNVGEFCLDRYSDYPLKPVKDPVGAKGGNYVFRGGGWDCYDYEVRSAARRCCSSDYRSSRVGFRLVLREEERV